tara:strand:- start:33762 stop:33971 length:210 start_codon:yes stop_codon:yes gene_type:complete
MSHPAGARREDGQIRAALLLKLQLVIDDGLVNLVIRDINRAFSPLNSGSAATAAFCWSRYSPTPGGVVV